MMGSLSIKKIMLFTGIVLLPVMGAIVVTNVYTTINYDELRAEENRLVNAQMSFKDIRYNIVQIQQFLTDVGATADLAAMEEAKDNLEEATAELQDLGLVMPEYEKEIFALIPQVAGLYGTGEKMAKAYINQGREAGNALMQAPTVGFDAVSTRLAEAVNSMAKKISYDVDQQNELMSHGNKMNSQLSISLSLVAFTVAIIIFFILYGKIITPINRLRDSIKNLNSGDGDLERRLPTGSNDEFGAIVSEFNQFIDNFQSLINKIDKSIDPVVEVANIVSSNGQKTREGAQSQAQETDQVATAVTEMSAAVNEVASNASITMNATKEAEDKAEDGRGVVTETVKSINALADEMNHASQVIKKLEGFSVEIGSVLDVIKGVAEQTNLLALNAAIEAARAGEQGRGFAVVADEVRTLAGRTQNSTDEIQRMIDQLQGAAAEAVTVMERGHQKVDVSVDNASKAGESLNGITESVATISSMTAQIAASAEEQSQVAEEINENIVRISLVAEKTVSRASDTSEKSGQLAGLAQDLDSLVSKYRN